MSEMERAKLMGDGGWETKNARGFTSTRLKDPGFKGEEKGSL